MKHSLFILAALLLSSKQHAQVLANGTTNSYALCNGTLSSWGLNSVGQLGNNSTTDSYVPVQISSIMNVTNVEAGYSHAIAIKNDSTVWSWGSNVKGELASNSFTSSSVPVQINSLSKITAVAAGDFFSVALKNDGTVWTWGNNSAGELGNGTHDGLSHATPMMVSSLSNVKSIAAGNEMALALKNDGTVWMWGYTTDNIVSQYPYFLSYVPVQVANLSNISKISGGGLHCLALKQDGTVWAWGSNCCGQFGDSTVSTTFSAVQVPGISGVIEISAGQYSSMALKNDGSVWTWGIDYTGNSSQKVPVQKSGLSNISKISAGNKSFFASDNMSKIWSWGQNTSGELGNGTTIKTNTPAQITSACVSQLVGISKNYIASGFLLYPNPCNGTLYLANQNNTENLELKVYNSLGEIIRVSKLNQSLTSIDLLNQPAGLYFCYLQSGNKIVGVQKLVLK